MDERERAIAAAPALDGLAGAERALLVACARDATVAAGELLFRAGHPATAVYLIRHGVIALELQAPGHDPGVVETLHDGDLVGWSWLLPDDRWSFDGRARAATSLVVFDAAAVRARCEADPAVGYRLMCRFAATAIERLQAARLQLLDVYAGPADD